MHFDTDLTCWAIRSIGLFVIKLMWKIFQKLNSIKIVVHCDQNKLLFNFAIWVLDLLIMIGVKALSQIFKFTSVQFHIASLNLPKEGLIKYGDDSSKRQFDQTLIFGHPLFINWFITVYYLLIYNAIFKYQPLKQEVLPL